MKVNETTVKFSVGKKKHEFKVYHDLPEKWGLNLEAALHNWLCRTDDYSPESLCDYIMSKETGHFAITEEKHLEIMKQL